ncbi:hypothetical protein, partial [Kistimonas scapharcae]|uniref:hypothetical protein n=1 Tax=Kistimonas scapharcae TaxID=1036133 RepID=UPI0031F02B8A
NAFKPQEISNTVWGLAKLREAGETLDNNDALKQLLLAVAKKAGQFTEPQPISNTVWGLAKLREAGETLDNKDALKQLLLAVANADVNAFKPQEISNTVWGLASMGCIQYQRDFLDTGFSSMEISEWPDQEQHNFVWAMAVSICEPYTRDIENKPTDQELEVTLQAVHVLVQRLHCISNPPDDVRERNQLFQAGCVVLLFHELGLSDQLEYEMPASLKPDFTDTTSSQTQRRAEQLFKQGAADGEFQREYSLEYKGLKLPPVDIWRKETVDGKTIEYFVEVQGPYHYTLMGNQRFPDGATCLKRFLVQSCLQSLNESDTAVKRIYQEIPVEKIDEVRQPATEQTQDWHVLVESMTQLSL